MLNVLSLVPAEFLDAELHTVRVQEYVLFLLQADTELKLIRRIPLPALIYTWWTCCCCFLLIREYCRFSALMSVVMRSIIMLLKAAWYSLRQELMAPGLSSAMLLDLRLCSSWGSVLAEAETRRGVSGGEQDKWAIDSTVTQSDITTSRKF